MKKKIIHKELSVIKKIDINYLRQNHINENRNIDINKLLNRVRQNNKKKKNKKIIFFSLFFLALSSFLILTTFLINKFI